MRLLLRFKILLFLIKLFKYAPVGHFLNFPNVFIWEITTFYLKN